MFWLLVLALLQDPAPATETIVFTIEEVRVIEDQADGFIYRRIGWNGIQWVPVGAPAEKQPPLRVPYRLVFRDWNNEKFMEHAIGKPLTLQGLKCHAAGTDYFYVHKVKR